VSNKANPAAIGAFVVGAVALAVVAVLVLGSGKLFRRTTRAVCFFTGDVMGLNVGAPVKFKGVDIGSVAEVRLRIAEQTGVPSPEAIKEGIRIPVVIELDNDKVTQEGVARGFDRDRIKEFIELGLRARLVSQSLVTGLLLVSLDFNPDIPPVYVLPHDSDLIEIPTMPTSLQQIQAAAQDIVRRLENLDLERLVGAATGALEGIQRVADSPALKTAIDGLPETVTNANGALTSAKDLFARIDAEQGPLLRSIRGTSDRASVALDHAATTLESVTQLIAPSAPLAVDLSTTLREFAMAAHSVRLLADSLDRNPSAIVRGTVVQVAK
jgi:paraquat-inducible protein B